MKTRRVIWSFLTTLLLPMSLHAAEIINVNPSREADHILVEYDLLSDTPVTVNVIISVQGVGYNQRQLSLEGDVGKNVRPGRSRRFIWNVRKDFPQYPDIEITMRSNAGFMH